MAKNKSKSQFVEIALGGMSAAQVETAPILESGVAVEAAPAQTSGVPAEPVAPVTVWRATNTKQVSLFGQMTTVSAGSIVALAAHSPVEIQRMLEQGVELEPVS